MVVYVAGVMRSGSTLAGQIAGALPGRLLVGEIRPTLSVLPGSRVCDCGEPVVDCRFWGDLTRSMTSSTREDVARYYGMRRVPLLLFQLASRRQTSREFRDIENILNRVVAVCRDCEIVDTSKTPVGMLLWRLCGQPLHVIHVVRGPRQVIRAQRELNSELPASQSYRTLAVWVLYNLATLLLRPFADSYLRVNFDSLLTNPAKAAEAIAGSLDGQRAESPITGFDRRTFDAPPSHIAHGNPRRVKRGPITIRR